MYVARLAARATATSSSACPTRAATMRRTALPTNRRPKSPAWGRCSGSAITEDPATGETTLKLGLRDVEDCGGRRRCRRRRAASDSVAIRGTQAVAARSAALPVGPGRTDALASRVRAASAPGARCAGTCCRRRRTRSRAARRCAAGSTSPSRSRLSSATRSTPGAWHSGAHAVVGAGQAAAPDAADRRGEGDRAGALRLQGRGQARARPGLRARRAALPAARPALRRRAGAVGRGRRHPHGDDRDLRRQRRPASRRLWRCR